jgi:MADS-box transcription factor
MNIDTPVSALPSRFMNNEFLPSPSSFYPEWNFRGSDSNTLPSPLNFATPVAGTGPSFLREETTPHKRKSPDITGHGHGHDPVDAGNEPKRIKVDS